MNRVRGGRNKLVLKALGSTEELKQKQLPLGVGGEGGILGVGLKGVVIGGTTGGEGDFLDDT